MKKQEIIEIFKKYEVTIDDFAFENIQKDLKDTIQLETGIWEEIDQYGGESMGDHWHSVKHFKEHDVYIKVIGWYQSYNGTEFYDGWGCCSQVLPQQKTITVYE